MSSYNHWSSGATFLLLGRQLFRGYVKLREGMLNFGGEYNLLQTYRNLRWVFRSVTEDEIFEADTYVGELYGWQWVKTWEPILSIQTWHFLYGFLTSLTRLPAFWFRPIWRGHVGFILLLAIGGGTHFHFHDYGRKGNYKEKNPKQPAGMYKTL